MVFKSSQCNHRSISVRDYAHIYDINAYNEDICVVLVACSEEMRQMGTPLRIGEGCSFSSFCSDTYKLHFHETVSGMKFILMTAPHVGDLVDCMQHLYSGLFVEHVVKNPEYIPGKPFLFENFTLALNKYMMSLNMIQ